MNTSYNPRSKLPPGDTVSFKEVEQVKAQILDMRLEIDILKETLDVLKKDPGAGRYNSSQESGEGSDYRCPER